MITLAILKQLEADEVAGLKADQNCWWEELPLQANGEPAEGVWIITRGGSTTGGHNGLNQRTTIDFYIAMRNKVEAEYTLNAIREWLVANPTICALNGSAGGRTYEFTNVRIHQTTTPQNQGHTANGLIVKMASASITFDQQQNN